MEGRLRAFEENWKLSRRSRPHRWRQRPYLPRWTWHLCADRTW